MDRNVNYSPEENRKKIIEFTHNQILELLTDYGKVDVLWLDGDMDFIAGNFGLNYKCKTTKDSPFDVYYEDFDSNDIVLGYYNFGKHYPVRGFSCSAQQVPELKKYDIFASLQIDKVYDKHLHKSLNF